MDEWGGFCGDTAADTTNKRRTKSPPMIHKVLHQEQVPASPHIYFFWVYMLG